MRSHAWIAGALCVALVTPAQAAEDVTKHPGYVDFGTVNVFGKEESIAEVFLDENVMQMVAAFMQDDPELKDLLSKLKQIRVQTFAVDPGKRADLESRTSTTSKKLESMGWQTLVKVRNPKEESETYVYMKWKDGKSQGLAVMNVEPGEAKFVNIVGEIDPEQLGKVRAKLDLEGLDSLDLQIPGVKTGKKGKP